jgi:hypothetical protein
LTETTNPAQPLLDLIDKVEHATTGTAQAAAMQTLRAEVDRTIAAYVERLREAEPPTVTDKQADQVLAALCKVFSIQSGYEPRLVESYDRHEISWEYGEIGWPREFIDHPDIDKLLPVGVWVDAVDAGRLAIYPRT